MISSTCVFLQVMFLCDTYSFYHQYLACRSQTQLRLITTNVGWVKSMQASLKRLKIIGVLRVNILDSGKIYFSDSSKMCFSKISFSTIAFKSSAFIRKGKVVHALIQPPLSVFLVILCLFWEVCFQLYGFLFSCLFFFFLNIWPLNDVQYLLVWCLIDIHLPCYTHF